MTRYLDQTANYLRGAADYAAEKQTGDMALQILCLPNQVVVRGCSGGPVKTWMTDGVAWDDVVMARKNPLLEVIDGVLFKMERHAAAIAKSA